MISKSKKAGDCKVRGERNQRTDNTRRDFGGEFILQFVKKNVIVYVQMINNSYMRIDEVSCVI